MESLSQDVTPYRLQLKKAVISSISPDFRNRWNNDLGDAERKVLKLLLKEVNDISIDENRMFDERT